VTRVGVPIHYWMQPPAASRAGFAASLRAKPLLRALAIGWVVVAAFLAWVTTTGAHLGQPWFVRLLALPLGMYFVIGAVLALTLVVPSSQVRLEPDAVSDIFGKHRTAYPLAELASYRLADFPRWRTLTLAKVDGTSVAFDVPLRITADDIHRYFAERGVPEGDPLQGSGDGAA